MYEMDHQEIEALQRVLLSKKLFRYQPGNSGECDLFEAEFSRALGVPCSVLISSGTNALVAALTVGGVGPGDEVLVPAYTFVATAAAVRLVGAHPVIVNVDEKLGFSVEDARTKVSDRTRALIPVHMDGLPCNMPALDQFARQQGLLLIEDCAQALGGSFGETRLGAFGDFGAFSLNENKVLSCGEGGIVVSRNATHHPALFAMQDLSARYNPVKKAAIAFPPQLLGMSMRMSEIQGAIMRVQLTRLESILERLRERKRILLELLTGLHGVEPILPHSPSGDCGSSLHLRFADPIQAAASSKALMAVGALATPITLRPAHVAWKWLDLIDPEHAKSITTTLLPSLELVSSVLKLDIDPAMEIAQVAKLGAAMAGALKR